MANTPFEASGKISLLAKKLYINGPITGGIFPKKLPVLTPKALNLVGNNSAI